MTTPPLDIAALRALAEKATPGPWEALNGYTLFGPDGCIAQMKRTDTDVDAGDVPDGLPEWEQADVDLQFIAACRAALPALLDELERMRELCGEAADKELHERSCVTWLRDDLGVPAGLPCDCIMGRLRRAAEGGAG